MNKVIYTNAANINEKFKGKVITEIKGLYKNSEEIKFIFGDESFSLCHIQVCTESVSVKDLRGEIELEGAIFYELIEKSTEKGNNRTYYEEYVMFITTVTYTWTFFTIKTSKGDLDIRWFGESNGFFSESVDLKITIKEKDPLS